MKSYRLAQGLLWSQLALLLQAMTACGVKTLVHQHLALLQPGGRACQRPDIAPSAAPPRNDGF
jgi:hypothetical protein